MLGGLTHGWSGGHPAAPDGRKSFDQLGSASKPTADSVSAWPSDDRSAGDLTVPNTVVRSCQTIRQFTHLAIETLYRAVYRPNRNGLKNTAAKALRTGRTPRRSQRHPHRPRNDTIFEPTDLIDQRPAEVADRVQPGHWGGDLIIGKKRRIGHRHPGRADRPIPHPGAPAGRRTAQALRNALIPV